MCLGFSAVIPGFPRYSVLGDRQHGVYNLKVSNASLEDDAEFQCQVGPAKFNSAIRANAKLTVICKYMKIKFEGKPQIGEQDDGMEQHYWTSCESFGLLPTLTFRFLSTRKKCNVQCDITDQTWPLNK